MSAADCNQPLAIIGMACRLPGAVNLDQYWQLILEGRSAVAEVPPERLDQQLYFDARRGILGKAYSKLAALLSDRRFDHARCPISEDLLNSVDNTHLLMTGVAADALRHAGMNPFKLSATNAAVFVGHSQGSSQLGNLACAAYLEEAIGLLADVPGFGDLAAEDQRAVQRDIVDRVRVRLGTGTRNVRVRNLYCNMVAGTVAKAFGLNGPWLALNSACASSLHAMLLGARALQLGRADIAIVGGASDFKSDSLVLFSKAQTLSATASRPFDSEADGLILSEGYVALVMKTLQRALADGDPIQAVVRGLGIASDGRGKSLWAPRKEGQMKAMHRAYRSGIDMGTLQYVEAHATSTQVGDATELETLGQVLGPRFAPGKKIPVTSVKANIGHTLEAAGIAGLIKTVLCMQHQTFPPAINVRALNPKINWDTAPYYIPLAPSRWEEPAGGQPRRAAVNAFGIGGLNMHVILDEFNESARKAIRTPHSPPRGGHENAVAIIGMGGIFPGADNISKLWDLLVEGRDPKSAAPEHRWSPAAMSDRNGHPQPAVGGFVTGFEFDWRKRKVPPRQVAEADPLQFMLLEAAEQALADAGYDHKPWDREKCGVVVGTEFGGDFCDQLEIGLRLPEIKQALTDLLRTRGIADPMIESIQGNFGEALLRKWPSLRDETGSFTSSTLSSRITKTMDLAGGALSIDSGSTSAMSGLAICLDMLLAGDNDLMICAAGQRRMSPHAFDSLEKAGLGPRGAEPRNLLDANYDGVVPAEGVGVIVLKRLADARRDGDRIHAVIRGLGIAHDSSHARALQLAAERSSAMAGIDPADVTFAELDTDEQLASAGDEIESFVAIHTSPGRTAPLQIGSSTAQFGHLGGAASMLAIIKACLEITHGQAAPAVAMATPAASLNNAAQNARMARGIEKLAGRRLGAVASWSKGLACHLLLEPGIPVAVECPPTKAVQTSPAPAVGHEAQSTHPAGIARPLLPVTAAATLSADDIPRIVTPKQPNWRIVRFAGGNPGELLAQLDVAINDPSSSWQTASQSGFAPHHSSRMAVVADGPESLVGKLKLARPQFENPKARPILEQRGIFYRQLPTERPRVALVFPGQGSQYEGMLREMVRDVPAAAAIVKECDVVLARLDCPTFSQLAWTVPAQLDSDIWAAHLSTLAADVIALTALQELGIVPDLVLGHGDGEFATLYAAGVCDLETAVRMARARCADIDAIAPTNGGMLVTDAPPELVERLAAEISDALYLANHDAPDQTVVGGKLADLESLARALEARSHQGKILAMRAALHTPLMAGASRVLDQQLAGVELRPPGVRLVSTVTNAPVRDAAEIRRNLAAQLETPVHYAQLISQLAAEQPTVFVEVGPRQTLTGLNRRILGPGAEAIACDNLKRPGLEPLLSVQALLECLGVLSAAPSLKAIPRVAPATQPAKVVTSSATVAASDAGFRNQPIPHFDATEQRRAKMRRAHSGAEGAKANGSAAHAVPPAVTLPEAPADAPGFRKTMLARGGAT